MCAAITDCAFRREAEEYGKESRGFPSVLRSRRKEHSVTLIYRRCAGMDVHKNSVSVCVRIRSPRDHFETETAVFRTFTRDLEQMADWLKERKIRQVAMESTAVYWKPVFNVLESKLVEV